MAIKKGFDNINRPDDHENVEERIYNEKDIQKVTDEAVKHIDSMTANKEKELLEV